MTRWTNRTAHRAVLWGIGIVSCGAAATAGAVFGGLNGSAAFAPQAVFSDTTPQFVSPAEPAIGEPFSISLRTGKHQVQSATLYFSETPYAMHKIHSDEWFDYYAAQVPGQSSPEAYYFEVTSNNGQKFYYSQRGTSQYLPATSDTLTVVPGFRTPAWAQGAVFYEIFPDRFYNGDKSNDVVTNEFMYDGYPSQRVTNWSQLPDSTNYGSGGNRTREFYGGDLQGIIDKLPYLKNLGIQALYLTPIFVAPSNHKYDTQDYEHVDPHFGKIVQDGGKLVNPTLGMAADAQATKYIIRTESKKNLQASDAVLARLIADAHKMGIRVVLDGVFNHTGVFNKWFDAVHIYKNNAPIGPGADEAKSSPFHNYYSFNDNIWPNNPSYDDWMGISSLPKLYYENSPKLVQQIYQVGKKWVSPPYSADGWRLDSAGDLGYSADFNLKFWDGFHTAVRKANKQALLLAEWYKDPSLYFDGKGFDSIQNYMAFLSPVSLYLTGLAEHSDQSNPTAIGNAKTFLSSMQNTMSVFPYQALYTAMNALDNHDVSRFLTRTNGLIGSDDQGNTPGEADSAVQPNVLEQGVLLDMTWPGDPTIYYGDEAGLTGWTDPDSRRTFPWGHQNKNIESFYHQIIAIHNQTSCFKTGSLFIYPQQSSTLLAYGRFDSRSAAVTVLNTGAKTATLTLPVWQLESASDSIWSIEAMVNGTTGRTQVSQIGGSITLTVPAHGGLVAITTKG